MHRKTESRMTENDRKLRPGQFVDGDGWLHQADTDDDEDALAEPAPKRPQRRASLSALMRSPWWRVLAHLCG